MVPKISFCDLCFEFQKFFSTSLLDLSWVSPASLNEYVQKQTCFAPPPAYTSVTCSSLTFKNLWPSCWFPFHCADGGASFVHGRDAVAFCPRRPRCIPFAARMKSVLMKLEGNVMLPEGDTWACVSQPFPLLLPNVQSCICLVRVPPLQGSGLFCCSLLEAWLLPPCSLWFMSAIGIGGVFTLFLCPSASL